MFLEYKKIPVSTKTILAYTNFNFEMFKLFKALPVIYYSSKKEMLEHFNNLPNGTIVTLKFESQLRGVELKKKSNKKKYFRNSLTVVIKVDEKLLNFKISRNGSFQITGCKKDRHAELCVYYIWAYIREDEQLYKLKDDASIFKVIFMPVMRNINFNIDFKIDREKFECALQKDNKFHAFLEDSLHAGVNIKVPYEKDLNKIKLKCIEFPKYERWPDSRTYITYGDKILL